MVTTARGNTTPSYANGYAHNASDSENPELWEGLVGNHMPTLGFASGRLDDKSNNLKHATFPGGSANPLWTITSQGSALAYNGDQYFDFGNVTLWEFGTSSFSIRCVFQLNGNIADQYLMDKGGSATGYYLRTESSNAFGVAGELLMKIDDGATHAISLSALDVTDGAIYDVVGVINRATQTNKIYVNGVELGSVSTSSVGSVSGGADMVFGGVSGTPTDNNVDGDVLANTIYSRALPIDQIKHLSDDPLAIVRLRKRIWKLHVAVGGRIMSSLTAAGGLAGAGGIAGKGGGLAGG